MDNLSELEEITATVGGIAALLGALCSQSEEENVSFDGLHTLLLLTVETSNKLKKITNAAYSKTRKTEKRGANVA